MDFSFSDEQQALRELTRKIFEDHFSHERLKQIASQPEAFARDVWDELAKADLLGVALPEAYGGSDLGVLELCLLLEEAGRAAAPLPLWATLVLGAMPILEYGTDDQRRRFLPAVARGETILSAALVESGWDDVLQVRTRAVQDGSGWRLDGAKTCVPAARLAERILIPARCGEDLRFFLVDPRGGGVETDLQETTAGEPQYALTLSGARVAGDDVLGGRAFGAAALEWLRDRALLGLCAQQAGVVEAALRITAKYTSTREQFGKPLATFQAVGQRAADAYIDVEAVRWTMWQAAWRVAAGLPATEEIAVAKFWASEGAHRVVYAAQHLHGGIGLDLDYPVHRYYTWSKQIELSLGSGAIQLARLGKQLAAS
jgi:alkylation response protein AidB-like acyl-CoA dehydrogenase